MARIVFVVLALLHLALSTGAQPPPNDAFANATLISGTNIFVWGSNVNASKESGEPNHAGNVGGRSVWWAWTAPASGYVKVSTYGSFSAVWPSYELDTVMGVYVGPNVSSLTTIASNDDGLIDYTSEAKFEVVGGTTYRIAVDGYNYYGETDYGSIALRLQFSTELDQAPPWQLPGIWGALINSTDYAGKVVVLNFWATWCVPCIVEIPDLIALQNKYGPDGLVVIGISVDNSPDGVNPPMSLVQSFAVTHQLNYPVVMSSPGGLDVEAAYGGISSIPTTFIIDRKNHIKLKLVGSRTFPTFEQLVKPLIYDNLSLKASVANGVVRLSWPTTQADFVVEGSGSMMNGPWTEIPSSQYFTDGANQYVDVPPGIPSKYFRLRSK